MRKDSFCRCLWLITWGLLALVACSAPSPKQIIVYQMDGQIWAMNPDGTQQHVLVNTDVAVLGPRLSPDGRKITITARLSGGKEAVWIADSNGANSRQVSPEIGHINAIWLNQDTLLTGVMTDTGKKWDNPQTHYVLDLRDGTMQEYARGPQSVIPLPQGDRWLAWNPISGTITLYSLNEQPQRLFYGYGFAGLAAFDVSPSGEEIVFQGWRGAPVGSTSIYKARIDPSSPAEPREILALDCCVGIRWSPDGKWIAMMDQSNQFYIVNVKTNEVTKTFKIEHLMGGPRSFIWSPDSRWLLVESLNYGIRGVNNVLELAKVDIQTGTITRLTNNDKIELSPYWGVVR